MQGFKTETVKNFLHKIIGKKGGFSILPHTSKSYPTTTSFAVFKKVLLIASSVWLQRASNSHALPVLPLSRAFAVLIHMSHSHGIDLCSPTLHASAFFSSLFGLFIWQLIHVFDILLCAFLYAVACWGLERISRNGRLAGQTEFFRFLIAVVLNVND